MRDKIYCFVNRDLPSQASIIFQYHSVTASTMTNALQTCDHNLYYWTVRAIWLSSWRVPRGLSRDLPKIIINYGSDWRVTKKLMCYCEKGGYFLNCLKQWKSSTETRDTFSREIYVQRLPNVTATVPLGTFGREFSCPDQWVINVLFYVLITNVRAHNGTGGLKLWKNNSTRESKFVLRMNFNIKLFKFVVPSL